MKEPKQLTVEQIFDRVMELRGMNKKQFAAYLDVDGSVMSSKLGAKWNLHWRIFLKLLPDLVKLKIITKEHLGSTSYNDNQHKVEVQGNKDMKVQDDSREKPPPIDVIMLSLRNTSLYLQ